MADNLTPLRSGYGQDRVPGLVGPILAKAVPVLRRRSRSYMKDSRDLSVALIQRDMDVVHERAGGYLCALMSGEVESVGTGNLLGHAGHLYILTCAHVAKSFFAERKAEVYFEKGVALKKDKLRLVRRHSADDIALIAIQSRFTPPHLRPLTVEDLHLVDDFRALRMPMDFIVVGCPARLVVPIEDWRIFRPMTYGTVLHPVERRTRSSLPLDYPIDAPGHEPLPHPGGLSESLIWEHQHADPAKREIWAPGRALALQSNWNRDRKVIRGKRLTKLREWLGL